MPTYWNLHTWGVFGWPAPVRRLYTFFSRHRTDRHSDKPLHRRDRHRGRLQNPPQLPSTVQPQFETCRTKRMSIFSHSSTHRDVPVLWRLGLRWTVQVSIHVTSWHCYGVLSHNYVCIKYKSRMVLRLVENQTLDVWMTFELMEVTLGKFVGSGIGIELKDNVSRQTD